MQQSCNTSWYTPHSIYQQEMHQVCSCLQASKPVCGCSAPHDALTVHKGLKRTHTVADLLQAVYDTLETKDVYSPFFGNCLKDTMEKEHHLSEYSAEDGKQPIIVGAAAGKYMVSTSCCRRFRCNGLLCVTLLSLAKLCNMMSRYTTKGSIAADIVARQVLSVHTQDVQDCVLLFAGEKLVWLQAHKL
jgi:hypothetical protein